MGTRIIAGPALGRDEEIRMTVTIHRSRLVALAATCLAATIAVDALADDLSAPLGKGEVVSLVVGKKVAYVRKRDGAKQAWDFKDGGTVYFTTSTTNRNTPFSGTYTLGDDGAVCFKWNQDKFLTMQDSCVMFKHAGDKLVVVGERNPNAVFGEVE
jgi:hypothetical protein